MALIQKAFSDIITFSRSSNATRVGPTGLVEYAPHNLILQSQTFDNASWTAFASGSVTANAGAAPDGTITADLLTWTSANASGIYQSVSTTFICTFSVFAKTVSGDPLIRLQDDTGSKYGDFNLSTGVATSSVGLTASSITSVGNGWYRCVIVFASAPSSPKFINGVNAAGSALIWGAQLAVGPYALDYTPTTSAAVYGPRFDFDPVTLAPKGLLVEEQRQNLLTYSEQFNNAAWTAAASKVSVSANSVTSPDGTVNADTITGDGTSGGHYIGQVIAGVGSGKTLSFYVKAGTNNFIQVFTDYTNNDYANFDLANGAVGSKGLNTGATTITVVGNGWYRCTMVTGDALSQNINFALISSSTASRLQSNTLSTSVHLWGAQLEAGSFATSYIPTLASTVTRSADVASVNTLSPWFNSVEGSFFVEADAFNTSSAWSTLIEPNLTSNLAGSRFALGVISSAVNLYALVSNSVTVNGISSGGAMYANNAVAKTAFAYKLNDYAISGNGAAVATDTSSAVPTIDQVLLGNDNEGRRLNGHLRRIAYFPRRLQNAELQALTA
jgi:hypothetical protein